MVRYLAGDLPDLEHRAAEAHVGDCSRCKGLVADLTDTEFRAEATGGSAFITATTGRIAFDPKTRDKLMWLERHYGIQIGDVIESKYRIERILGEGGMGIVLLATHLGLRDKVALKFMHPSMVINKDHAARFVREARAAVKLRDENVARVLDLGEIEGTGPFIVMEYLEGEDLLKYLKAHAPLPVAEAVELIRQAASGVTAAHNAQIIHRDLKPGNMFLTERRNKERILKVLDFGVSKYIDGDTLSMTGTNMVVGSPVYMAPEMFESARNASFSSDVWALGVIFYRMLSGKMPFNAESLPEMVAKIHFGEPTPLATWRNDMPIELIRVIEHCLARSPLDRFSSAAEFLNALAQLPPSVRGHPAAPTTVVPHLSRREATEISGSQPGMQPVSLAKTVAQPSAAPRRSPWVFTLVGAVASAAVFAAIVAAMSSSEPQPAAGPAAGKLDQASEAATQASLTEPDAGAPEPVAAVPDAASAPVVSPDAAPKSLVSKPSSSSKPPKRPRRPKAKKHKMPKKPAKPADSKPSKGPKDDLLLKSRNPR